MAFSVQLHLKRDSKDGWTHQMASLMVIIMPPWVAALNWHREWREGTDLSNPAKPFRLAIAFFLSSFPRIHNKISWQSDLAGKNSYKWACHLTLHIKQDRKKDCWVPMHSKCWHNHLVLYWSAGVESMLLVNFRTQVSWNPMNHGLVFGSRSNLNMTYESHVSF